MESVGGVDDLELSLTAQLAGGEAAKDSAHRGVAVENLVVAAGEDVFQLPQSPQVPDAEGSTGNGDGKLIVTIKHAFFARRAIVNLPPLFPEPPHEGTVELGEVCGVGQKKDFIHGRILRFL